MILWYYQNSATINRTKQLEKNSKCGKRVPLLSSVTKMSGDSSEVLSHTAHIN